MATYHPSASPQIGFNKGYFETLMRWTGGNGSWPAFWLASIAGASNPNYPDAPPGFPDPTVLNFEWDILEAQGSEPDTYYGTAHYNTNGLWGVPDSTLPPVNAFRVPFDFAGEWHIISGLWTDTELIWYIDHKEIYRVDAPDSSDQDMMVILQMEVGGWTVGADETTPDELHSEFDYVRVYQLP
jgi:beta-glucanase (GH16 family)